MVYHFNVLIVKLFSQNIYKSLFLSKTITIQAYSKCQICLWLELTIDFDHF